MVEAFVTTIYRKDEYVGAALVLAHSLRKHGTKKKLVVMVTSDVSKLAREMLGKLFDQVVEIKYIEGEVVGNHGGKRFKHMYHEWLHQSFTKYRVFELEEYKKVVLLDADMLALDNLDEVFELKPPAGICSAIKQKEEDWHGKKIPKSKIRESLDEYGIRGCFLLLRPSKKDLNRILDIIDDPDKSNKSKSSHIGPDERVITEYFWDEWTHVSSAYGCTSWKTEEIDNPPKLLHYVTEKPWSSPNDWPDFRPWKEEAEAVIEELGKESERFFGYRNKSKESDQSKESKNSEQKS